MVTFVSALEREIILEVLNRVAIVCQPSLNAFLITTLCINFEAIVPL